jgi:hypothetical protein
MLHSPPAGKIRFTYRSRYFEGGTKFAGPRWRPRFAASSGSQTKAPVLPEAIYKVG